MTAYEMRIIDWSSDVCSSDLHFEFAVEQRFGKALAPGPAVAQGAGVVDVEGVGRQLAVAGDGFVQRLGRDHRGGGFEEGRFEVREVRLRQAQARGQIGRATCREGVCQYV